MASRATRLVAALLLAAFCTAGALPAAGQAAPAGGQSPGEESSLASRSEIPITRAGSDAPEAEDPNAPLFRLSGLKARAQIVDRTCRILRLKGKGWYIAHFDRPVDLIGERRVALLLPSPLLETIERLDPSERPKKYVVTAEATEYQNQMFLLLRQVQAARPEQGPTLADRDVGPHVLPTTAPATRPADANAAFVPAGPVEPAPDANGTPAAGEPTTRPVEADRQPAVDRAAERMMSDLRRLRAGKTVVAPAPRAAPNPEAASGAVVGDRPVLADGRGGGVLVDRIARLLPESPEGWKQAVLVADNRLDEPPLRVLPNRMLQRWEGSSRRVRISGEVILYKGRRYLLLRKVLPEYDLGQF